MLEVALLQIAPAGSLERNQEKGTIWCRKAKKMGADIALFPEMFSNGYDIYDREPEQWMAEAIPVDSAFVSSFGALAGELDMAIGITLLERTPDGPRNTLVLFDRHGNRVLTYAKVHTCDFGAERPLAAGNGFFVADLDTREGNVKVGAMICYDREFPESARLLMLQGAEIVLVPNACPMEINRLSQLRGRAYENMIGIATCNYPETVPDCNGHSSAFDGVAYWEGIAGSRDMCILEADGSENLFMAEFDMQMLRIYRQNEVHGNAFRRPALYAALTQTGVEAPFVRPEKRIRD